MLRKVLAGTLVIFFFALLAGGWVVIQVRAYDAAASKVWEIPLADVTAPDLTAAAAYVVAHGDEPVALPAGDAEGGASVTTVEIAEAQALADDVETYRRGEHLARSLGTCLYCHGEDLATPEVGELGPVGVIVSPNVSPAGKLGEYSDADLHRLLVHGVKRDGTTLIFMNPGDFRWWPDEDILALIGWLRTRPGVDKPSRTSEIRTLGKLMDRTHLLPLLVAERVAAQPRNIAPPPSPTAEYGASLALLCMECHGKNLSGGRIPGAPPSVPPPSNLTRHESGMAHYDFAAFETLMRTGTKPDGAALDPFMPIEAVKHMSDLELQALWAFLQSVEPRPFGGR